MDDAKVSVRAVMASRAGTVRAMEAAMEAATAIVTATGIATARTVAMPLPATATLRRVTNHVANRARLAVSRGLPAAMRRQAMPARRRANKRVVAAVAAVAVVRNAMSRLRAPRTSHANR